MLHETTAPTAIHPRASTRTRLLRLASIFASLFARGESRSQATALTTTRCHL
jgi:hypothetical protein